MSKTKVLTISLIVAASIFVGWIFLNIPNWASELALRTSHTTVEPSLPYNRYNEPPLQKMAPTALQPVQTLTTIEPPAPPASKDPVPALAVCSSIIPVGQLCKVGDPSWEALGRVQSVVNEPWGISLKIVVYQADNPNIVIFPDGLVITINDLTGGL